MRKFLNRLSLFFAPILCVFSIVIFFLWHSKENFFSIDKILNSKKKYMIGYAYHELNYRYVKWASVNSNDKKCVWALGASRVLQFKEQMFDSSFYNAGYTISSIRDFKLFLQSLSKYKYPDYLIIGLDQMMFNSLYDNSNSKSSLDYWKSSFTFYPSPEAYWNVGKDLLVGKYGFSSFTLQDSIQKIGLNSIVNNKGYLNDGSMFYGNEIDKLINKDTTARDYKYTNTLSRLDESAWPFFYGDEVNSKAIIELDSLLDYCRENKIRPIAFLPPFADTVYLKMIQSGNYNYLKQVYPAIKPLFRKYNFEIYNFPTMLSCGSSDLETIDGCHGGDVTYQRLLINMLDSGSVLREVANIDRLKNDLLNRKNNYIIYKPW